MMCEEIWKKAIYKQNVIENLYVSNFGNVKKINKQKVEVFCKIYNRSYKERGNKQEIGYKKKTYSLHTIIAETFLSMDEFPPIAKEEWAETPESAKSLIKNCMIVDHIDNNPYNNNVKNLRWVTPRQNNKAVKK
jgi:hypothetical protein